MDVRSLANNAIQSINSDIIVTIRSSTGFGIDPNSLRQIPVYLEHSGIAQIQALDGKDLKQLDGLNINGTIRALYIKGELNNVIKARQIGGDLVLIAGQTWLVVKVLEGWPSWTKVAIVLQDDDNVQ